MTIHNYSKLVFNTHFPWEDRDPQGGTAQEYSSAVSTPATCAVWTSTFISPAARWTTQPREDAGFSGSQSILFNGGADGVLYRQLLMRKPPNNGVGYIIDLAEITIPGGVIRVDRCRLAFEHELTLGHFGLPHVGGKRGAWSSRSKTAPEWSMTASIPGRQVALIAYHGWDEMQSPGPSRPQRRSRRKHRALRAPQADRQKPGNGTDDFGDAAQDRLTPPGPRRNLSPVSDITLFDVMPSGSVIGAEIILADGTTHRIDFGDIDGFRSC